MRHYITLMAILTCSLWASDEISIKKTTLEVRGQKASIYAIDGRTLWNQGEAFNIKIANDLGASSSIHFQGLLCPVQADGTPYLTGNALGPDRTAPYSFPLSKPGSYFFVGSFGLQQQSLLTAPLVVMDPQDTRQQVVMLLEDFSFKSPRDIWQGLREHVNDKTERENSITKTILSEIDYDAYLTNKRTLENPSIIVVQAGTPVRLRIMNASCMTPFFISTGSLTATILSVDAQPIQPLQDTLFEIAPGQRLDLELLIPPLEAAYPILAEAQGTNQQTGMILRTERGRPPLLSSTVKEPQGRAITLRHEFLSVPITPLIPKTPDRIFSLKLEGDVFHYIWSINGSSWPKTTPLPVKLGERVEITFNNASQVAQTLSLHGHTFQIVNIDGTTINGPMRNTVHILPNSSITIQFDANNLGIWPLTSQQLYHRWGGMTTEILYEGFKPLYFTDQVLESYYMRYGGRPSRPGEALELPTT